MRRPVFLSFCYKDDVTRVQQIRNMGMVEEQNILNPNDFEQVKRKGEAAIKKWIDDQLMYKQCLIVLVGENTANRPFVKYEIMKAKEKNEKSYPRITVNSSYCSLKCTNLHFDYMLFYFIHGYASVWLLSDFCIVTVLYALFNCFY